MTSHQSLEPSTPLLLHLSRRRGGSLRPPVLAVGAWNFSCRSTPPCARSTSRPSRPGTSLSPGFRLDCNAAVRGLFPSSGNPGESLAARGDSPGSPGGVPATRGDVPATPGGTLATRGGVPAAPGEDLATLGGIAATRGNGPVNPGGGSAGLSGVPATRGRPPAALTSGAALPPGFPGRAFAASLGAGLRGRGRIEQGH